MSTDFVSSHGSTTSTTDSHMKTKATFSSIWNNVKYFLSSNSSMCQSQFTIQKSPIFLLGQPYHLKMSDSVEYSDRKSSTLYYYEKFKHDFYSRIWLTYRREFPPLLETNITSDSGWGCMIRSGQMILAQALLMHLLGRTWRFNGPNATSADETLHRTIISWFSDSPNCRTSPFSIHQIVKLGQKFGKLPGDWFGPSSISFILKAALERASTTSDLLKDICCYVAQDCTVYLEDVVELCTANAGSGMPWHSVFIMIPVRLGGECFNSVYSSYIKEFLSLPFCVGIIGGKPRHSLYFVGFQDDKLIYMDPHYCQKAVNAAEPNISLDSFHCLIPRKVSLQSIDPSCAIGFFIKSKQELDLFVDYVEQIQDRTRQAGDYPIFVLSKDKHIPCEPDPELPEKLLRMKYRLVDSKGNVQKVINTEEFVLL